jgi:hypothetical protein
VSPRRIDYYDDPAAPKATSLVPSVNVVVVNDAGKILTSWAAWYGWFPAGGRRAARAQIAFLCG